MLILKDLLVRDTMTPTPQCLESDCTVRDAHKLLVEKHLSGAPVLGDGCELLGVFSLRDFAELEGGDVPRDEVMDLRLDQVVRRGPVTCAADATVVDACALMVREHLHRIVVTDFGTPVGVFSAIDAARVIACLGGHQEEFGRGLRGRDRTEDPEEVMGS